MGESACLAQPFTYPSGDQLDRVEGNPMSALTQSISFGRFVSESASWDRWSVFPSKSYVEEAEKFSRPGSVAQKKAFFEAHYKEMAARKKKAAAALLEQAITSVSTDPVLSNCGVAEESSSVRGSPADTLNNENKDCTAVKSLDYECGKSLQVASTVEVRRSCAELEFGEREADKLGKSEESDMVVEEINVSNVEGNRETAADHCNEMDDAEWRGSSEMEKPLLKDSSRDEVRRDTDPKKQAVACKNIPRSHKASSCVTASPAVAASVPLPSRKVSNITPISRNSSVEHLDIKRPIPRRLPLGNLTPIREISKATVSRKIGNHKTFSGATKDCPTPSKTPRVVCSSLKYTLATPSSESKRMPDDDGTQTGPKRRSLAKECSKFLSTCKNKLQSPSLSTPFRLRTEERAARRKEKLEEKFDADEREKLRSQSQNLLKDREEMEVKKFRQTLCFKARPLPKFYRESTAAAKCPVQRVESNPFESSRHNRKLWSSTTMPRGGGGGLPQLQGKKPALDISQRNRSTRENRSPNISL